MRFRVTASLSWDIESEGDREEVIVQANNDLLQAFQSFPLIRHVVRLERLRERRCPVKLGEFLPEDVLPFVTKEDTRREYQVNGKSYSVRMNSHRYFIFQASLKCAACGLEGTKMILEQNVADKSPHFNLYAVENGRLVLMTKDHTQPRSKGGSNFNENLVTCCVVCNNIKGDSHLTYEEVRQLRNLYNQQKGILSRRKLSHLIRQIKQEILQTNLHKGGTANDTN